MFVLCPKRHHDDVALRQASMGFGDLIPMFVNRSDFWRGRSWRSIELLISDLKRTNPQAIACRRRGRSLIQVKDDEVLLSIMENIGALCFAVWGLGPSASRLTTGAQS
jgi:hypothetical protein